MDPIQQAFELASQHLRMGQLNEAERLCRQILSAQPAHAGAAYNLGLIACQIGRHDLAAQWIHRAISLAPGDPVAHRNLGECYRLLGRLEQAIASYRQALALNPRYAEAHLDLGNALCDQGNQRDSMAAYQHALEYRPDYFEAYVNMGNALRGLGRVREAVNAYLRATELCPTSAAAHFNLGLALRSADELEKAIAAYRRALELQPDFVAVHYNMGNALSALGRRNEAIHAYRSAVALQPDYSEAHINLGLALREQGRLAEAVTECKLAIQLSPNNPEARNNLGCALNDLGSFDEAAQNFLRALTIRPDYPEAFMNLGNTRRLQGRLDDAISMYRRAIALKADYAEAYNNLANALKDQARYEEAMAAYHRGCELNPGSPGLHSNLVYTLLFVPSAAEELMAGESNRWSLKFGERAGQSARRYDNDRTPGRRLRIGYVSPDFKEHVIGRNLVPLFVCHDRAQFEITCYSDVMQPDLLTGRFSEYADHWHCTVGMNDDDLSALIQKGAIDILVDLTQHMTSNRLPLFARAPAPLQVSFAGYPESTGMRVIEHRISDRWLEFGGWLNFDGLPVKERAHEQVYLLDSFWCYDPCGIGLEANELPAASAGSITFGSLNNFCKVNDPLLRLWARVLKAVPDSRISILSHEGSHRERTVRFLVSEGVDSQRVEFLNPSPRKEYLALYQRVDIVLDSFPYNGHTTSLDALWMGVPVVSLCGERAVSRAGLSQLSNLGLPDLVALTEDQYVEIATRLAGDIPRLQNLRATLRERMEKSVLMNAPHFARQIEACYRSMWRQWCANQTT